ncbi:MAG: aminotransferase class III-fold pyridoxal phosphate-dependent enzyme [Pseudolysinimonas sp.]|uniref:aspartate aminotransferase family protein n=1 Tax=Pseudolysinimonas sp. TaxID=2680009 RepID=UPI00326754AC
MTGPTTYFDPARVDELPAETASLVKRRIAALGPAYRLFYREPVEFVRGERAHLFDRDGVDYLDAYNNVPSVGHAHPRVVAAIAEQAARLNTHTRYLDAATVAYAEDLLSTFPSHLGNVMFTCTGSEANDLALRIAKAATGGTGVIVSWNAYHGVTTEVAAVSPSLVGIEEMAPWARAVRSPHPDVDIAEAVIATLGELEIMGIKPAALLVDTVFASDGVYPDLPSLAKAVAAVRKAGGLFIADEVQAGFGRLGSADGTGMWGFQRADLQPDIVTLGKPMGNGHPVAGLVARPELTAAFAAKSRYFNTFGGNPVAIAAAQATLDVLRDEQLPAHAARVGERLMDGIRSLGSSVAAVRGAGLFIGVDLVGPDGTPDEGFTLDVVDAMKQRRVLLATAGADNTTLKIRPPLPFDDADADRLLEALAAVLEERA